MTARPGTEHGAHFTMSPHRAGPTPYLEDPSDRTLLAVAHGRTRDLDCSGLTPRDLADMRRLLVADWRRIRLLRTHRDALT